MQDKDEILRELACLVFPWADATSSAAVWESIDTGPRGIVTMSPFSRSFCRAFREASNALRSTTEIFYANWSYEIYEETYTWASCSKMRNRRESWAILRTVYISACGKKWHNLTTHGDQDSNFHETVKLSLGQRGSSSVVEQDPYDVKAPVLMAYNIRVRMTESVL